jgi:hypothetical protein
LTECDDLPIVFHQELSPKPSNLTAFDLFVTKVNNSFIADTAIFLSGLGTDQLNKKIKKQNILK